MRKTSILQRCWRKWTESACLWRWSLCHEGTASVEMLGLIIIWCFVRCDHPLSELGRREGGREGGGEADVCHQPQAAITMSIKSAARSEGMKESTWECALRRDTSLQSKLRPRSRSVLPRASPPRHGTVGLPKVRHNTYRTCQHSSRLADKYQEASCGRRARSRRACTRTVDAYRRSFRHQSDGGSRGFERSQSAEQRPLSGLPTGSAAPCPYCSQRPARSERSERS